MKDRKIARLIDDGCFALMALAAVAVLVPFVTAGRAIRRVLRWLGGDRSGRGGAR